MKYMKNTNSILKSDFSDYQDQSKEIFRGESVVWAGVLDKQYALEIQRKDPYIGIFYIFDLIIRKTSVS